MNIDSSSSLERLDEDYHYKDLNRKNKRRKLEEDFEALSIEDFSEKPYATSGLPSFNFQCRGTFINKAKNTAFVFDSENLKDECSKQAHSKRSY